jgi:hypothetical protein
VWLNRDREAKRRVLGEVTQTLEGCALLDGERRVMLMPEEVVFRASKLLDVHPEPQRARVEAHSPT